jgi:hypothetical protein
MTSVFPPGLHGLPCDTGPRLLALTGSSSQQLLLHFRAQSPIVTRSPAEADELPPPRSRPPSRHQYQGSTCGRFLSSCLGSARSVSHALGGFIPLAPCRLVSSRYRVRGLASGGFPVNQPYWLVTSRCPPAVMRRSPAIELPRSLQLLPPRLQGVAPVADSSSPTGFLRLPATRSPLAFSTPRGFLCTPWNHHRGPSAHDLPRRCLE